MVAFITIAAHAGGADRIRSQYRHIANDPDELHTIISDQAIIIIYVIKTHT